MRYILKNTIIVPALLILLQACNGNKCEEIPNTSAINIHLKIERLENQLSKVRSKQELKSFLLSHKEIGKVFSSDEYPNDSIFFEEFFRRITNAYTDTIFKDVSRVFGSFNNIENELTEAFKNIKYYYPNFIVPQIKTLASGFLAPDFYFTDSTIYISLDYFTGPTGHYRPPQQPEYIVKNYRKEYIVPTIIRIISSQFNATYEQDKTMMADIIYWGKSYVFVNKILPCIEDSLIIGYTGKELERAKLNQEKIWAHFVQNQLLFETSHFIKNKYIGPRPYTAEISGKCPGRIGQWLGWKIVNKFMREDKKNGSLQVLMSNKNSNNIFSESKFKPKNGEGIKD